MTKYFAGGNVVLLYASKYHDIYGVINLSGRYKLDRGISERLGKEFLEKIKRDGYIDVKNGAGNIMLLSLHLSLHLIQRISCIYLCFLLHF